MNRSEVLAVVERVMKGNPRNATDAIRVILGDPNGEKFLKMSLAELLAAITIGDVLAFTKFGES